MSGETDAAKLVDELRNLVKTELPGNEYVYEYHPIWRAANWIEAAAQAIQSARLQGLLEAADIAAAIVADLKLSGEREESPDFFAKARLVGRVEACIRHRAAQPQEENT